MNLKKTSIVLGSLAVVALLVGPLYGADGQETQRTVQVAENESAMLGLWCCPDGTCRTHPNDFACVPTSTCLVCALQTLEGEEEAAATPATEAVAAAPPNPSDTLNDDQVVENDSAMCCNCCCPNGTCYQGYCQSPCVQIISCRACQVEKTFDNEAAIVESWADSLDTTGL